MPVNKRKAAARKANSTRRNSLKAEETKPVKAEEAPVPAEEDSEAGEESGSEEEVKAEEEESDSEEVEEEDKAESAQEEEDEEEESKEESSESESSERGEKRKAEEELEEAKPKKTLKIEKIAPNGASGNTVFVGSIDFKANEDHIREHFSGCGKIAAIRLSKRNETQNKGTCYIDFADKEGHDAALKLNGAELRGRALRVDHAEPAKKETLSAPSNIVFVANLPWSSTEEEIEGTFSQFGEVLSVTLLTFAGPGGVVKSKGVAYIEFADQESATKAITELENAEVGTRPLRLDYAQPRGSSKVLKRAPKKKFGSRGGKNDGGYVKKEEVAKLFKNLLVSATKNLTTKVKKPYSKPSGKKFVKKAPKSANATQA